MYDIGHKSRNIFRDDRRPDEADQADAPTRDETAGHDCERHIRS
jgi:hypothetical protein